MNKIQISDDFIKLGQALKKAGLVSSGIDAKVFIQEGKVQVNGEEELRRGRKLYKGDTFTFDGKTFTVDSME